MLPAGFSVANTIDPASLLTPEANGPVLWIGALSFEERCLGSLRRLFAMGCHVTAGLVMTYRTRAHPLNEDHARRAKNRQALSGLASQVGASELRFVDTNAYAAYDAQMAVAQALDRWDPSVILLDISCMTRLHVIALTNVVARRTRARQWIAAYTSPENYGNLSDRTDHGWEDVIMAPIADHSCQLPETRSRGIIIPGHLADRLIVGLGEVEPHRGLIVMAESPRRPDLVRLCAVHNRKVIRHLTRLGRMEWQNSTIGIRQLGQLVPLIRSEVEKARQDSAPIILFPYGPQALVFVSALLLVLAYPEGSWFVCPVPFGYNVNYTEGIDETYWIRVPPLAVQPCEEVQMPLV